MTIEHTITEDRFRNREAKIRMHERDVAEWEARLASNLIERWGLVAVETDGEDAGGRQKIRRLTPEELVREACDTAGLAIAEFRKRGWVHVIPSLAEIDAYQNSLKDD